MTKIEHIIGEGPELAKSQQLVLEVMQKHSDHLFRLANEDIAELQAWMTDPNAEHPPMVYRTDSSYAAGTIRWAISTLYHRSKIGSIVLDRRTYYGSHEAVKRAWELDRNRTLAGQLGSDKEILGKYIEVSSPKQGVMKPLPTKEKS